MKTRIAIAVALSTLAASAAGVGISGAVTHRSAPHLSAAQCRRHHYTVCNLGQLSPEVLEYVSQPLRGATGATGVEGPRGYAGTIGGVPGPTGPQGVRGDNQVLDISHTCAPGQLRCEILCPGQTSASGGGGSVSGEAVVPVLNSKGEGTGLHVNAPASLTASAPSQGAAGAPSGAGWEAESDGGTVTVWAVCAI